MGNDDLSTVSNFKENGFGLIRVNIEKCCQRICVGESLQNNPFTYCKM